MYLILLLLAGLMIAYILRYHTGVCLCNTIPKNAEAVVLINARNLEQHLVHDVLLHPLSYLSREQRTVKDTLIEGASSDEEDKLQSDLFENFALPKSFLFYRIDDPEIHWISSKIKVKNVVKLTEYLEAKHFSTSDQTGPNFYKNGRWSVHLMEGHTQLAYCINPSYIPLLSDTKTEYMSKGDALYDAISTATGDAVYSDISDQQLEANFRAGAIHIDGTYDFKALQGSAITVNTEDNMIALSALFNVPELIRAFSDEQQAAFVNFTKLDLDSIRQHWNGSLHGALHSFDIRSDTIKTYEYDDDFNKIEVAKVEEVITPGYSIQLGMAPTGISYMKDKKAIVEEDGQEVLAIMPLSKTYCAMQGNDLQMFTHQPNLVFSENTAKLILQIDMGRLMQESPGSISVLPAMFSSVNQIKFRIENDNRVEGRVSLDGHRNALAELIRS